MHLCEAWNDTNLNVTDFVQFIYFLCSDENLSILKNLGYVSRYAILGKKYNGNFKEMR